MTTMQIEFANQLQAEIARLLWSADTPDQVAKIRRRFGVDAEVVYHMIVATALDEIPGHELAGMLLEDIFRPGFDKY